MEKSKSVEKLPESMKPGCSSNSQRSSIPISHNYYLGNHHSRPKPPATPDDVLQPISGCNKYYNSGNNSRSDEPTFHHGLQPESKSKNSKQDSRIHDPLELKTGSLYSMGRFSLRADSESSSGNSQRSGSADPTDSRRHERSASNQSHRFGTGVAPNLGNDRDHARDIRMNSMILPREGSSSSRENARKKNDAPIVNMKGVAESSPKVPNLNIEGSLEPTLNSNAIKRLVANHRTILTNFTHHEFIMVNGKSSNGEIPHFKILAYLYSRMGRVAFIYEMTKYFKYHCRCKNMPSDTYLSRAFDFYVNHTMRDHARMPRAPSPNHIFDFDKDFRSSSGNQSVSLMISNKTVTEEHDTKNSSIHSGSIQVPSTRESISDSSKHESKAFPGPVDAASYKEQSASSVARKEAVPSHTEHRQHAVEKNVNESSKRQSDKIPSHTEHRQHAVEKNVNESSKRQSDKSFPMKQPGQNRFEPDRKVPKTASSHLSVHMEPTTDDCDGESRLKLPKASSSRSGFQGNQIANFSGESYRKAPKTTSSHLIVHTEPTRDCDGESRLKLPKASSSRSGFQGNQIANFSGESYMKAPKTASSTCPGMSCHKSSSEGSTSSQLISPIASSESPDIPTKEKRPEDRSKAVEKHFSEPSTSRLSPIVDVVTRLSPSMSSPDMELARPGASKGSPSVDVKVNKSNRNYGPSTSKGASKAASKEKKLSQTKKKPEGKLWLKAKKNFDALRKRNRTK